MKQQRIAIVGTGAQGGAIGADLVRAGLDVTFIEQWPEHVAVMRSDGIRVITPLEDDITPVTAYNLCDVATLRAPYDIVLVAVKAYDTRWACELIRPLIAPDGLVIGIQNGMTLDTTAEVVGPDRTLGCVIEVGSHIVDPGIVHRDSPREASWFAVGGITPEGSARAHEVAAVLQQTGRVEISDDIRSSKWTKLILNSTELVPTAIVDMTISEALSVPGMRKVMLEAGKEAARTALALGRELKPIIGMESVRDETAEDFVERLFHSAVDEFFVEGQKTTVIWDWIKGRRSEVHELNGYVADQQHRLGGEAPVNAAVTRIATQIEAGELSAGLDLSELLLASVDLAGPTT